MTDPKTPQQTSDVNYQQPLEEETTFIDILAVIVEKKALILLITSIFTILTFGYYFLTTPIYRANISFLPPSHEIYLSTIDPNLFTRPIDISLDEEQEKDKNLETSTNIWSNLSSDKFLYRQFLTRVQSFSQQKEVFLNKKISEKFFGKSPDPGNLDQRFVDLHNAISLQMDLLLKPVKKSIPLDKPADLEMEGANPIAIAEFLNALADSAKTAIIKETQYALQALIDNRLKIALNHKELLRFKASKDRLKKIQFFSDALKIAQKLGVKKNGLHVLKNNLNLQINQSNGAWINSRRMRSKKRKSNNEEQKNYDKGLIPIWFLFGANALKEEIRVLNSKTIDDNYIEELVDLEDQIKQLQAFDASRLVPTIVLIEQPSIPPIKPVNLKVEKVFSIGLGLGLLFGIIAAFLSHSLGILRSKSPVP